LEKERSQLEKSLNVEDLLPVVTKTEDPYFELGDEVGIDTPRHYFDVVESVICDSDKIPAKDIKKVWVINCIEIWGEVNVFLSKEAAKKEMATWEANYRPYVIESFELYHG
jgi:hypothetical protein